ncbi:MAG: GntR family transcriptional regulator [Rhizobiaceae bacterium]
MAAQTDEIRAAIIADILEGKLLPGDTIDENALSERFGVSITPIREAFIQLHANMVIERRPRAGAVVYQPDVEMLVELIEVHAELEGAAAYYAARRASKAQIDALKLAEQEYEKFFDRNDRDFHVGYKLNLEFHLQVFGSANNQTLFDQIDQTGLRLVSFFRAQQALKSDSGSSVSEHRAIVEAISEGRPDDARKAMITHVKLKGDTLLDVLSFMNRD